MDVHWCTFWAQNYDSPYATIYGTLLGPYGVFPFQDDIAIATKGSKEDHEQAVLKVLEVLTYDAGLRLQLKKCKFFCTEVRVLGSLLTRQEIKMDALKIKAITDWPRPTDGKALQRFLGAANFHREFSHEFSRLAAPLETIRNISGPIDWTRERLQAFEDIKQLFSRNLLLRFIDWQRPLYLTTDASLVGIGAWLGQKDEHGEIQPVICVSKKLSATQMRWSATK